ncbi:MAG: outer membrane beta-barrel protein [Gemmatimonadota bacterium]|nr:MAG: outer membrane beta-barrel protein [Gemmatimonadota bacterium]
MRRYRTLVLALTLALVPSSLSAQTQFAISGFGGAFLPASDLTGGTYFFGPGEISGFDGGDVAATFSHKTAFNFGGRLTVWPSQRIGFEAEAAFVLSDMNLDLLIPIIDPGPPQVVNLLSPDDPFKIESNVFMGSVNFVYGLIRPPLEPLVVFVSVGVGFVSHGGDSGDWLETTSNVAGTWGFGLKYGVARGVWLRGDVRDYFYKFEEGDWEAKWQNDLLVNAGLEFSFGS